MKALVIDGPASISLRDVPAPAHEGECLIRVRIAGICGTDLQLLAGYAGFNGIPGHEFVGVVDAAGSPDSHWIGKRVVGEINIGCGRCAWCASGVREHCTNRAVVGIRGRDGAFAEQLSLPAANLHEIPETMSDETAVFVEPAAAACRILDQVVIGERDRVAVLGDGRMGLLVAQVLKTTKAHVTIVGRHDRKLAIADSLGLATRSIGALGSADSGCDVVVDATGRPGGLRTAMELVRPRGTIVLKSTFHGEAPLEPWPIVVNEVTIVGSRCGPFRRAIDLLSSGAVDVAPLISRVAGFDEYESAFADARQLVKVLLVPNRHAL